MATKRNSRKSRKISPAVLGKPRGVIQVRVQKVGPERFGIVAVDCAKVRSKWMLCDFYGKVLIPPTVVEHQRAALELATVQLREAIEQHGLEDHIVAVEMTGTYHRPVQRAFRKAGSETRLVHPFASRHYRLPAHADTKTDDHDLEGIFRAAVNGFGLVEPEWEETYRELQILARHRRDLVKKRGKLQSQIRQALQRCLPGYADLFPEDDLWTRPVAMAVARRAARPETILNAGVGGVLCCLREEKLQVQKRTVERLLAWAGNAAATDPLCEHLARVWHALYEDWQTKTRQIDQLEQDLAGILVKTPYLLLLSHPGINVVTASELAGETGPIEHYAHAKAISGRAGLFPARYQSDEVDRADGPLARFRNARLRGAWMRVADCLVKSNAHYRGKAELWKQRGVNPRDVPQPRCQPGHTDRLSDGQRPEAVPSSQPVGPLLRHREAVGIPQGTCHRAAGNPPRSAGRGGADPQARTGRRSPVLARDLPQGLPQSPQRTAGHRRNPARCAGKAGDRQSTIRS